MNLNTSRFYQDEKSLQSAWFKYYKKNSNWDFPSVEEGMVADYSKNEFKVLQEHQYLIIHDLKIAIKKLNKKNYEKYKSELAINENDFYDLILNHVKFIYSIATSQKEVAINYLIHQYIFSKGIKLGSNLIIERKVEFKKKDGSSLFLNYTLISNKFNELGNENIFRLVKEKKIRTTGLQTKDSEQYPDFAIYINGLPAYVIEFKTPTASWKEAWNDYKNKASYHIFWACFGIDGVKAFISSTYNSSNEPRLWAKYGKNKNVDTYGAKDIADELICNRKNLIFYAYTCLHSIDEHYQKSNKTERFLEALSVQQYYTILSASSRFEMLTMQKNSNVKIEIIKDVVKHVQRSGKSKTIRGIITALFTFHNGLYKKVYIQVPDITIRDQFLNRTFGNSYIINIGNAIKIRDQNEYIKSINSDENALYVMNMQKISDDAIKYKNNDRDILIILDEVHTHQLGENFQIRLENFPNASYISFTATPRITGHDKNLINMTNTIYADGKTEYMDEFTSTDAIDNNVIIPIVYEKANYSVNVNETALKKFDSDIYNVIKDNIDNPPNKIWKDYKDQIDEQLFNVVNLTMLTQEDIEIKRIEEIKKFVDRSKETLLRQLYREIKLVNNPQKIKWIVDDILKKRATVYSNPNTNELYFKTKSFLVVDDIEMATEIICGIKKQYGSCTVNGIRFAVDYSFLSSSESSTIDVHKKYFPEMYEKKDLNNITISTEFSLTSLDELNGVPVGSDPILDEFSTQINGSVDVLIIVGKYIMGYDNPNLVSVYCDTEFNEISRIYQLATRPATKRENKLCGYFIDLGLGNKNIIAYKNAIQYYESMDKNITTFVLDDDYISRLNIELKTKLEDVAKIIGASYPEDFNNLNKLDIYLESLETNNLANKSNFFIKLTEINKILKKLAIPTNYPEHRQSLSILGLAISNFFDLLKAKKVEIIRFSKDDLKSEINDLFLCLGFIGGIKDVLDYQIKHSEELKLSEVTIEKAKVNKRLIMLKTKLETEDKYLNSTIYEKIKELIQYCEQNNSVDVKNKILDQIETIKNNNKEEKAKLNSVFNNPYERVIHDMLSSWIESIGLDNVWSKEIYKNVISNLSEEVLKYFKNNIKGIRQNEIKQLLYNRYPPIWGDELQKEENFTSNPRFIEFRDKIISFKNKRKDNQDLIIFFEKLLETLVLTFEENKGIEYV